MNKVFVKQGFLFYKHHGNLETGVYRKPTHTNKYLAFDFHHPICHKTSLTKTLFMKAECLPSSSDSKAFERKYVIDVLKENNYPKDFLQNCLKPVHPSRKTTENDSSMMGFALVPYIHGVTEPIKRIVCCYNVKVAQKTFLTLNHIFAKPILCRTNKNQTLYIPSRAMSVIRSRSDRLNVSLGHV